MSIGVDDQSDITLCDCISAQPHVGEAISRGRLSARIERGSRMTGATRQTGQDRRTVVIRSLVQLGTLESGGR